MDDGCLKSLTSKSKAFWKDSFEEASILSLCIGFFDLWPVYLIGLSFFKVSFIIGQHGTLAVSAAGVINIFFFRAAFIRLFINYLLKKSLSTLCNVDRSIILYFLFGLLFYLFYLFFLVLIDYTWCPLRISRMRVHLIFLLLLLLFFFFYFNFICCCCVLLQLRWDPSMYNELMELWCSDIRPFQTSYFLSGPAPRLYISIE